MDYKIKKLIVSFLHFKKAFISNEVPFKERLLVYAIFPIIGITFTALIVKYLFHSDDEKELSYVLKDISQHDSKMKTLLRSWMSKVSSGVF